MSDGNRTEWRNRLAMHERVEGGEVARRDWGRRAGGGGTYFLGLIGALWWYVGHGSVVLGILKSLVWPATVVYHLLSLKP